MKREALAALTAETINAFHSAYIVQAFGAAAGLIPPEVIQQLLERGILDPAMLGGLKIPAGSMELDPFLFLRAAGKAMNNMSGAEIAAAREWSISDWQPIVASILPQMMAQAGGEIGGVVEVARPPAPDDAPRLEDPHSPRWLSNQERAAHSDALARAGDYARGLGNSFAADIRDATLEGWEGEQIIEEVDPEVRENMRRVIREETARSIVGERDANKLARDLADRTKNYSHGWERIAETELQAVHNIGRVNDAIEAHGADAQIARITESGACRHCLRLFRDAEGLPRVFSAEELISNGTNVGRKPDDWKATVWPVHPRCRCDSLPVPTGMHVTEDGRLRKRRGAQS